MGFVFHHQQHKQVERMLALLECLRGKSNKAVEAYLLKCFAARERLTMIKAEPAGKDIQQRLVSIMAEGPTKTQAAVVDAHASLDADELAQAFIAACRSRKAPEVFSTFSSYLTAKVDVKNKRRDPAQAKYEAIAEVLLLRWRHRDDAGWSPRARCC